MGLSNSILLKDIGKIYDFHSRFLHGDIKISNHFYDDFEHEWDGWQFTTNFDAASAILIKCLQTMAERDWTKVNFSEVAQKG